MKKKGFILSLIVILTMITTVAFAEGEIIVKIDSVNVEFNEEVGAPFIDENNRTLVPFRAALEAFGADIEWDAESRTAKAIKEDIAVEIPVGEKYIVKNGEKIVSDTAAIIKDGRTYLPIRNVIEAFGSEVQWDSKLNTVVITTEPFDAKAKVMNAYENYYKWENYDMYALINMSMAIPDGTGNMQQMNMQMDMDATAFTNPMKMKVNANMAMDLGIEKLEQPLMEMYVVTEDDKFTTYMGMTNMTSGELTWVKQELEDENFATLLDPNNEEMKALNEKSIANARYLGTYAEGDRNLEKYEITISYEAFNELMGQSMAMFKDTLGEDAQLGLDLLNSLGDVTCILYLDEATGEFAKQEMDMSSIISTIMEEMMTMIVEETPEAGTDAELDALIEMLKGIKMDMVAEYKNINEAEDFEIPEEALNAITTEELLEKAAEEAAEVEETEEEVDSEEVSE
ncbi:copper amine oxidase N-terminal domain-containing protein [Tissierella sp. Yu-01]|uniref:copper amine oxidase N-terminal domain-containing protein n=1 Tax=Tissierella sp. Yu-01 TaxID=3035694 RepID=UPI00240E0EDA|nr:copper amine oxidase N-terminal domain-containing protein [Tissierella sp. Yu-01]WFA09151.1 copper amine oxidase N-terminal domain-containing protein [Tissierella sp. Yu-01]